VTSAVLASLGNDPSNQFSLQSIIDLPANIQFDVTAGYVDTLPDPLIPRYFTSDARLAWQFKNLELSVLGQNLLDNRHPEFGSAQQIPRSIYGKIALRFSDKCFKSTAGLIASVPVPSFDSAAQRRGLRSMSPGPSRGRNRMRPRPGSRKTRTQLQPSRGDGENQIVHRRAR